MKTVNIVFVVCGILIIPCLLNIFLGINIPCVKIKIVGTEVDWLMFYGSYLGAVLTVLIGLFTLYRESRQNVLNIKIQNQSHYIETLSISLSNIISSFNYWYLGSISMFLENIDNEKLNSYLWNINESFKNVTQIANSWGVLYDLRHEQEIVNFRNKYLQSYNEYKKDVDEITKLIITFKSDNNKQYLIQGLNEIISNAENQQKHQQALFDAAKIWISKEENKLLSMEKELKGFMPKI